MSSIGTYIAGSSGSSDINISVRGETQYKVTCYKLDHIYYFCMVHSKAVKY